MSMYEEAIAEIKKAKILFGESTLMEAVLGHAYAASGKKDQALKILNKFKRELKRKYASSYYIAGIYADLEEKDNAFHWLETSVEKKDLWLAFLKIDPLWDNIRSDPRFSALLKKIS